VPTLPFNVLRVWAGVFGLALASASVACARGGDDVEAPLRRDGAATGGGAGAATAPTSGPGGSDPATGAGGFAGADPVGGSAGSAGVDQVDSSAIDPDTGADALADVVEDINTSTDTGAVDARPTDASVVGPDINASGTIVAFVPAPIGGGNKNLEVIRDGVTPPVGSMDSALQFDSFHADPARTEDWIGYTFAATTSFARVVFQDGRRFVDGGWFATLKVQVRQANVWVDVPGLSASPTYAGMTSPNFTTYQLDFPAISGDGIRIDGAPGGSNKFISVGELRVFRAGP
jgi:hypothetical protein